MICRPCRRLLVLFSAGLLSAAIAGPLQDADTAYANADYGKALRIWRELAEQGDATAQSNLGRMYRDGRGVSADQTEAVKWLRKAAEQGHAGAQVNLGFMYSYGRGVSRDDEQAVVWFRRSAEQGDPLGLYNLGVPYEHGKGGLPRDDRQALELFRKAAAQGHAAAEDSVGTFYLQGRGGLLQDETKAVEWFRKSADQGNPQGQANLGFMYEQGRGGLAQNEQQAVELYTKSAERGNATGQTNLGNMYQRGRGGLAQDDKLAAEWYRKAAAQGDTRARTLLASIEERGTPRIDLSSTIAELVRANELAQTTAPDVDPDRERLAREVIEIAGEGVLMMPSGDAREKLAGMKRPANAPPRLWEAIGLTLVESFQVNRIRDSWERKLAQALDTATLEHGLQWERSAVAEHMRRLERDLGRPERQKELEDFVRALVSRGGRTSEPRARACAQADTLSDRTDALTPVMEALAGGMMIVAAQQQAPAPDMDAIQRTVMRVRPAIHEAARETLLAQCLLSFKDLSEEEMEEWLQFLRSDAGGKYARGYNNALRDALLDVSEVFTRTLIEVARRIKKESAS